MDKKKWGMVLLIAGIILVILSLGADILGIGAEPGFGYKQIAGLIVGVLLAVFGYILTYRK